MKKIKQLVKCFLKWIFTAPQQGIQSSESDLGDDDSIPGGGIKNPNDKDD